MTNFVICLRGSTKNLKTLVKEIMFLCEKVKNLLALIHDAQNQK